MNQFFKFNATDSNSDIRRKIVNLLILGQTVIAVVALAVTITFDITAGATQTWDPNEMVTLYAGIILMLITMPVLFLLNQRFTTLASWLLLFFVWAAAVCSDVPDRTIERGLVIFTLPIIAASAVLPSWTSFVMAGLGSLTVAVIETVLLGKPYPNFVSIIVLFAVAFISYLSSASKESVLGFVRKANTQLGSKLEAQQQNLLQIVNDFAFLADSQENAVMLYGPDKKLVLQTKVRHGPTST